MKKLNVVVALMVASPGFISPAMADEINKTIDAEAKSEIRVTNIAGDVEIEGWSRNEVELEADLGSGVKELIFERNGREIIIEVKVPKRNSHNISSDLIIKVPEGSSLEVGTVSADITVDGVHGRLRLNSVSGDVESSAYGETVWAESVSGDVDLRGNNEEIRTHAQTVSGDIEVERLHGEIKATAVSGDITVYQSRFEEASLQTVNGDISYEAGLYGDSRMDVETVNGSIYIEYSGDVSARFDIETFNGDIDNCFGPKSERTSKYAPGRELKFTEGGGKGRVTIRTLNGDLDLCKN